MYSDELIVTFILDGKNAILSRTLCSREGNSVTVCNCVSSLQPKKTGREIFFRSYGKFEIYNYIACVLIDQHYYLIEL